MPDLQENACWVSALIRGMIIAGIFEERTVREIFDRMAEHINGEVQPVDVYQKLCLAFPELSVLVLEKDVQRRVRQAVHYGAENPHVTITIILDQDGGHFYTGAEMNWMVMRKIIPACHNEAIDGEEFQTILNSIEGIEKVHVENFLHGTQPDSGSDARQAYNHALTLFRATRPAPIHVPAPAPAPVQAPCQTCAVHGDVAFHAESECAWTQLDL
jgi:hypothetical protein